jgi:copper chaperone CopZ
MSRLTLHVRGMGCRRCVREVSARLRDVVGVQLVTADMTSQTVTIVGDMASDDVLAALRGTTYRPRIIGATTEG